MNVCRVVVISVVGVSVVLMEPGVILTVEIVIRSRGERELACTLQK